MSGHGRTILVVEDDHGFRSTLSEILRFEGFAVITARDGDEGYLLAMAHRPDLIITDLQMPGLDGFGMVRLIRRQNGQIGDVPIIALSGSLNAVHLPERVNSGIDRIVDKSATDRHVLMGAIESLLIKAV